MTYSWDIRKSVEDTAGVLGRMFDGIELPDLKQGYCGKTLKIFRSACMERF